MQPLPSQPFFFRPALARIFALSFCVSALIVAPVWAGGGPQRPPQKTEKNAPKTPVKPAVSAPLKNEAIADEGIADHGHDHDHGDEDLAPLGGPKIQSNAQTTRPNGSDNPVPAGAPTIPGVTYAGAEATTTSDPLQPAKALGPPPFNLGKVVRVRVGEQTLTAPPMRVGNLDILAPLVDVVAPLGISITESDPLNSPRIPGVSQREFFQINQKGVSPIVLAVGKANAWQRQPDGTFQETALRSAPLVMNAQLYLPALSLCQLVGAAPRLGPDGTLVLSPTIQSVEIFPVGQTVAVTIKSSAPVPEGAAIVKSLPAIGGNKPKLYVDFRGFSMGFDAGNSTSVRLVANGALDVLGGRAGQPFSVTSGNQEVTRVTFDLAKPLEGFYQKLPEEPNLYALILAEGRTRIEPRTERVVERIIEAPPGEIILGGEGVSSYIPQGNLRGLKIVVDAGHGAHDSGARGAKSYEKNHTLDISRRLANLLRARGATVLMTREGDSYPSLQQRVAFANYQRAHAFISIHMNASVNKGARGTETFYSTPRSISLARSVHPEFIRATGLKDRGISSSRFYVTRNTSMPSLLLECAFITNADEEKITLQTSWRDNVAQGITRGIARWWESYGKAGARG